MTSCTELLEALMATPNNYPWLGTPWRTLKLLGAKRRITEDHLAACVEALEGQGLLLDCLETVCVGLPPADREAADNFIEQIAMSNRKALAALRTDLEAALEVK